MKSGLTLCSWGGEGMLVANIVSYVDTSQLPRLLFCPTAPGGPVWPGAQGDRNGHSALQIAAQSQTGTGSWQLRARRGQALSWAQRRGRGVCSPGAGGHRTGL